jgi:hypothetical protein
LISKGWTGRVTIETEVEVEVTPGWLKLDSKSNGGSTFFCVRKGWILTVTVEVTPV